MGIRFDRYFTRDFPLADDSVLWKTFNAEIEGSNFRQEGVEFPAHFSQQAVNIVASKYFYGKLINNQKEEQSFKSLVNRVIYTNALWGALDGYFTDEDKQIAKSVKTIQTVHGKNMKSYKDFMNKTLSEDLQIYIEELKRLIYKQAFSFNSPVWFNIGNPYSKPQVSACFIIGIEDTMESIEKSIVSEMEIYRAGSGSGINYSALRSSKERISGGGYSSGPCSFMKVADVAAGVTKSGGKTRRAAQMRILNVDHGDIEDFILQKSEEEKKALTLIANGYSSSFDDPKGAYGSVFFQNSNQSVRVTDAFMRAVEADDLWVTIERYPRDINQAETQSVKTIPQGTIVKYNDENYLLTQGKYFKIINGYKARYLFDIICKSAWTCGDPGMQFDTTINKWHTCPASDRINGSNPCSEYMFIDNTSCNLGSLKLTEFLDANNNFDAEAFTKAVHLVSTALDIWIDRAYYPTTEIAEATKKFRTIGLGFTDLGALLLRKGLAYGSEQARLYASLISALMTIGAYAQSSILASKLGSFPEFEKNAQYVKNILFKHKEHFDKLVERYSLAESENKELWNLALKVEEQWRILEQNNFVVRNAQTTVIAPTGTISFMMDCETTGIEPPIALISYKTIVGGGLLKLVIPSVRKALQVLGYSAEQIEALDQILNSRGEDAFIEAINPEHRSVFATALSKTNTIDAVSHVKMMAAVQPFISGAISKTVNMPNSATVEDVKNIYTLAWKEQLKAIAIYRDGSKGSQPVTTSLENKDNAVLQNGRPKPVRKKLPATRPSITHKFTINGVDGFMTIGLYENGQPGEVFIKVNKEGSTISGFADSWATMFSIALQYGVSLEYLIDKFMYTRFEPAGFTDNPDIRIAYSIIDYIAKYLKLTFLDGKDQTIPLTPEEQKLEQSKQTSLPKQTGIFCRNCGGPLIQSGSCMTCPTCGETTGCG